MTPDLLQHLKDYRAGGGTMVNFTFLPDGGVQISIQNADRHSWSCGMGESVEDAIAKAFGAPKTRKVEIHPPMSDRSLAEDDEDWSDLI